MNATPAGRLVEQTPMRAAIARRMTESQRNVPHFYVSTEVSTASVEKYLQGVSAESGIRVSMTAALVRACASALLENPIFNSLWTADGLLIADDVNVAVAVAVDGGLVAPAILGCGELDLLATALRVADLVERARAQKLRPAEMTGATFTLSNLGMFDVSSFAAIVTPPQVGILAVGRSMQRVVAAEDESFVTDSVMAATLSADHRAVDGADAARFLATFKSALESPGSLSSTTVPEEVVPCRATG